MNPAQEKVKQMFEQAFEKGKTPEKVTITVQIDEREPFQVIADEFLLITAEHENDGKQIMVQAAASGDTLRKFHQELTDIVEGLNDNYKHKAVRALEELLASLHARHGQKTPDES